MPRAWNGGVRPIAGARAPGVEAGPVPLPPAVRLGDLAAELVVPREIDVVKVETVEDPLFLDLAGEIFDLPFDVPLAHVG